MILKDIIENAGVVAVKGRADIPVSTLCSDSRKVGKGALFVAVKGYASDGHAYIPQAIRAGAAAIAYEDENILLLDKKPGVLCHSAGDWSWDTLIANIQAHLRITGEWDPKAENSFAPALCNRIDRNTGGIVIAAKNAETLRILNQKIKDREIEKYYLCAVHGKPHPAEGRLEGYLFKDAAKNQVYVKKQSQPGAKTAVTEYRTLKTKGALSLVECRLLTGRTHQIRAQMADAGWPLLGDGKYGKERVNHAYGEKGQNLYSYKLEFTFPTDAGILEYLRGRVFQVENVPFVEKFFPGFRLED